jgi:enoyl-CoA hydratase
VTGPTVDYASFRYIHTEVTDGIATVRCADPNDERFVTEAHPMHRELRDIFGVLGDDDDVTAVVFSGGTDSFCPFPELRSLDQLLVADPRAAGRLQREAAQIAEALISFAKPLVASVAVDAMGMGCQVALFCDFIVTTPTTRFQDTHVKLGLASGDGAVVVWPLVMGLGRARRHLLRGYRLTGQELSDLDLVETLVDRPEEVHPQALILAGQIAAIPPVAFAATKAALNQWLRLGSLLGLGLSAGLETATYESPEFMARRLQSRRTDP